MPTEHSTAKADVDDTWTELALFRYNVEVDVEKLVCQVWAPSNGSGAFEVAFVARSSVGQNVPDAPYTRIGRVGNIEPADDTAPMDTVREPATLERVDFTYDDLRVMARRTEGTAKQTLYARANATLRG